MSVVSEPKAMVLGDTVRVRIGFVLSTTTLNVDEAFPLFPPELVKSPVVLTYVPATELVTSTEISQTVPVPKRSSE